jgi:hypothetical protein
MALSDQGVRCTHRASVFRSFLFSAGKRTNPAIAKN